MSILVTGRTSSPISYPVVYSPMTFNTSETTEIFLLHLWLVFFSSKGVKISGLAPKISMRELNTVQLHFL